MSTYTEIANALRQHKEELLEIASQDAYFASRIEIVATQLGALADALSPVAPSAAPVENED